MVYGKDCKSLHEIEMKTHVVPLTIVSDRDNYFTSRFSRSLHEDMSTKLCLSTTYHPHTDG